MERVKSEKRVILASQSPRRIQLLKMMGIEAEVRPSEIEEKVDSHDPAEVVLELSRQKARDVAERVRAESKKFFIIAADTVVSIDGKILGKPKSAEEACEMLRELSGKSHQVYTGVMLLSEEKEESFYEETEVCVAELTEEEIRSYVESGEPMDKAGSYGIQGSFARHISGIRGDYYNVMGLPIAALYQRLKSF